MVGFNRRSFRVVEIIDVDNCIIEFDGTIWHVFQTYPGIIEYGQPKSEALFAATSLMECEKWAQARLPLEKVT